MDQTQKVLLVDASSSFYRMKKYKVGDFFGPVDLGLHLSGRLNSLNIGSGLLAGSIFPGSNRLVFSGFSPCWGGFYISSMGGAALIFENLGINMLSIIGKAHMPSVLYLNRVHGEEVEVEIIPVDVQAIWSSGRKGIYSLMDHVYERYGSRYSTEPRILVTGPAALASDFGGICSVPIRNGQLTFVDTWAGRGGFGTKMLRDHGIAAIIYGGTVVTDDFRDRTVADSWFQQKYQQKLAAKDIDATTKYRYDPQFNTGGTFGVNFAQLSGRMMSFNYKSIYWDEAKRVKLHEEFILNHYLKQFNEETIQAKQQKNCGEPCAAVCKKMNNEFKKDYEPYQTMGPLCGIFDQRAAEMLNHHADMLGFDAISVGGVLSWMMECLSEKLVNKEDFGVSDLPVFNPDQFRVVIDSMHNAKIGTELLDSIIGKRGLVNLTEGARKFARRLARTYGMQVLDGFVYNAYARNGWMVPNQYWTPGALSPMAIMGKYYMNYSNDFIPPRDLGRKNADRMIKELVIDNLGICRFHRGWAEEMIPEIIESLIGQKDEYLDNVRATAARINARNSSVFWESRRSIDYVFTFLKRKKEVEGDQNPELINWIKRFEDDIKSAALDFWYEIHKGVHESLREFR